MTASHFHPQQRPAFFAIFKEKELYLLLLAGVLFFYRPLFLGETFFFRDLLYDFIPQKQMLLDFVSKGEWPLWDIYRHGGQPYFADPNNSVFHPANLLFFVLPFFRAFNLILVGHALLYLLAAYLLTRILGFSPKASLMSAAMYGFCGYTLSLINLYGRFLAMSYLPLLLLGWHLFLMEQKRRWFVFSVIFGLLQVLCGAPEVNVICMLTLLGWALCFPYQQTPLRKLALWLLLNIFVIGLASIQLFPTIEMALHSSRGDGMEFWEFASDSLRLKRLPALFIPNFFGYVDQLPFETFYWGYILRDGYDYPYILNIYFGAVALLLGLFGGLDSRRDTLLTRPVRRMLLGVFAAALLLSLGRFLPGFKLVYRLPMITLFRYPIKFLLAGLLPLSLLAGYAAEQVFRDQKRYSSLHFALYICSTLAIGLAALFALVPAFAAAAMRFFFEHAPDEFMTQSLRQALTHVAAILLLTALCVRMMPSRKRLAQWGLAGVILFDLLFAGMSINPYAPEEMLTDVPPVAQAVRQQIGGGRLFRMDSPQDIQLYASSSDIIWSFRWGLETLDRYFGAFYRLPVIFHDDYVGLAQRHIVDLKGMAKTLPWPQKLPMLDLSGVTAVITPERLQIPGVALVAELPNRSNIPFFLYRLNATRIRFVASWESVRNDGEAIARLASPPFDPARQVVLHPYQAPELFERLSRWQAEVPAFPASRNQECAAADITPITAASAHAELQVKTLCEGFLVFSEPFYPGWRVYANGERLPIYRANLAFSAVYLPQGTFHIERRYVPLSLIFGAIVSAGCGIVGVILLLKPRRRVLNNPARV